MVGSWKTDPENPGLRDGREEGLRADTFRPRDRTRTGRTDPSTGEGERRPTRPGPKRG